MLESLDNTNEVDNLNEILKVRREKLKELQENNKDPFNIVEYDVTNSTSQITDNFDEMEGEFVSIAGRLMSKRGMGKASFCDIQDREGRIQLYVRVNEVGKEVYEDFKKYDIGDVIGAKGNKDRYTILSKKTLQLLREYWTNCGRPREWLFPSNDPEKHIIPRTVQKIMKTACQTAGITKNATPHTLRHCFSTHMLEAGVSIFIIKVLLGHSSISSTCRYLHMVRPDAFNIKSPLDVLDGDVNA
jgi:lysyl-tRNA synthetase class II